MDNFMTADLKELISKMTKVSHAEYGKLWKEYSKIYKAYTPTSDFDAFIHSDKSIFDDLDGGVTPHGKKVGQLKLSQ